MSIPTAQYRPTTTESNPEAAGFSAARLQRVSDVLRADCESGAIPGAVAVVMRAGKQAYFEAFGYADRQSLRPMRRDSLFRIASMTKPLTAVAALLLMEQGQLPLTDPVSSHLPELCDLKVGVEEPADAEGRPRLALQSCRRAITVHDLMRHTAGFTYGQFGDSLVQQAYRAASMMENRDNAHMVAKLSQLPLAYQPGTTFEYGMSTDVLGRVVEVISGMTLDRFFAEYITGPLGMRDTRFGITLSEQHRLAEPRRDSSPGAAAAVSYDPARPSQWFSGGGGLLSTAGDYVRFVQMLLNHGELDGVRLLARKTVQLMLQNHLPASLSYGWHTAELGLSAPLPDAGQGYGLGIGVRTQEGLAAAPGSPGDFSWGGAAGPYFWADPLENMGVVFMLQELDVGIRTRYRPLLRSLVYQALR